MTFHELDSVVLLKDHAEHGLRQADLGTVVFVHGDDAVEVEFVQFSGRTHALVTLRHDELRAAGDGDLMAVRRISP